MQSRRQCSVFTNESICLQACHDRQQSYEVAEEGTPTQGHLEVSVVHLYPMVAEDAVSSIT